MLSHNIHASEVNITNLKNIDVIINKNNFHN